MARTIISFIKKKTASTIEFFSISISYSFAILYHKCMSIDECKVNFFFTIFYNRYIVRSLCQLLRIPTSHRREQQVKTLKFIPFVVCHETSLSVFYKYFKFRNHIVRQTFIEKYIQLLVYSRVAGGKKQKSHK